MARSGRDRAARLRAHTMSWPVRSGAVPPLAVNHSPRPESGAGPAGKLSPGETVVLVPADQPADQPGGHPARLGGTGKTQVAAALAHEFWETGGVDLLVWVSALSRDAVVTAFAQALGDMGVMDSGEDLGADAARFLAWLADTGRPWMVVLDDLADPADLAGLWPRGDAGRVLVTTRRRDDLPPGPDRRVVPVGPFSLREALAYLTARLRDDPGQRTEALDLATDLGCHPLALAQATALMTDIRANCRDYRLWLADRRRRLNGAEPSGAPTSPEVTCSLSLDRASQLPPAGLAQPALLLAAMMDPSGIPGAVLVSPAACSYITGRRATPADGPQVRDAVNNLSRLGLLTINPASAARTLLVHASVQALVLKTTAPAERDRAARAAADALLETWPEADAEQPLMSQALRDAAAKLHGTAAESLWTPEGHGVLIRAGQSREAARLRGAAIAYWQDAIVASTKRLGPAHAQTLLFRDHLAAAQETAGRLEEPIGIRERTLADRERVLGPSHPETLTSYANLAHSYQQAGRLDDAITLFERTLADREWVLGPDHPDTLAALGSLAHAYQQAGRLNEAIATGERNLADRERVQGPDHPDTLAARGSLASAYLTAGRLKNAIPQYERTLADRERVLGPGHLDTLTARANLANAYHSARRVKDALPQYQRTLADSERAQGPDHPDTLTARGNLASAYHSAGRLKDALPLYEQTLADRERVLGPDHPTTLTSRGNLAHAYHSARRPADAIAAFERTLADCERALGPSHPLTQATRENLAAIGHR
jgi:tetratricopeptide (TPR) repeat protein